jgi:hypothetical protein
MHVQCRPDNIMSSTYLKGMQGNMHLRSRRGHPEKT